MLQLLSFSKTKYRLFKLILCFALALCITGIAVIDAYSAPFLVALQSPVFIAIAKTLIAAGVTFITLYGMNQLVTDYWNGCSEDTKAWWNTITGGMEVVINDTIWATIRAFISSKVTGEGLQSIAVPTSGNFNMVFNHLPYETPGGETQQVITSLPATTYNENPDVSGRFYCVIGDFTGKGDIYAFYANSMGSAYPSYDQRTGTVTVSAISSYGSTIYTWNKYNKVWNLWGKFSGSNNKTLTFYTFKAPIFWYAMKDSGIPYVNDYWDSFVANYPYAIRLDAASVNVQSGTLAPDYNYVNTNTNTRAIYVPTDITDANVAVKAQDLVNVTNTALQTETMPIDVPVDPPVDLPILDVLNGIKGTVTSIPLTLTNIFSTLTDVVATGVTAISTTLTGAISTAIDTVVSNTAEEEVESRGIFDFVISLVLILKHLVLIVIKFLMFVVIIRDIPAQSSLFNENTKAVIDYIHYHNLPVFGISFMQIINAFIGILVAVSVIRIINRNVRSNL